MQKKGTHYLKKGEALLEIIEEKLRKGSTRNMYLLVHVGRSLK